ncbi:MAG: response regulator [Acidobacteria bacterium]|nr:response regulator [Acidobacteriota bacterium]
MTIHQEKVLVVDDDPNFRLIVRKVLTKAGFTVTQADDGQKGLDAAEHDQPGVILLDWMMPVLDGPSVCRRLRENPEFQNLQIIMVSAKGELDDKVSGLDSGADDYLVKPCEPKELLARVRSAMRIYELKRQLADKANREALLRRIADRIRSSLNIEEILRSTVEEIRVVARADRAVIFELDAVMHQMLIRTEAIGSGVSASRQLILEGAAAQFFQSVLDHNQSNQISDIQTATGIDALSPWIEQTQVQSIVAVPILLSEKRQTTTSYGLALHQCTKPRTWSEEEITFLESMATQTGIALQHARLFAQAQQQARRESLLNRTTERITRSLDLDQVFQATVDELRDILNASRCVIFEIDEPGEFLVTRCESVKEATLSVKSYQIPLRNAPIGRNVLAKGETISIADLEPLANPPLLNRDQDKYLTVVNQQVLQELMPKALFATPLHARGKVVAGLAIHQCDRPRPWEPEEVEFIVAIANQTGLAIERAQLFQEIQDRNHQLSETVGKLEELARQREEFTAVLVHDIRSPLSVVLGVLELLEFRAQDLGILDENLTQLCVDGFTTVNNIVSLVNEILDFSKAEAGGLQLELTLTNPIEVVQSAVHQLDLLATQKQITIKINHESNLPMLSVDAPKINRALVNLLSNAVKFTPVTGEITITTRLIDGRDLEEGKQFVAISVIDNGPGIPAKDLPYLFNPYYQARQRTRHLGTGLGLAIVQRILAAHGGKVSVQSTEGLGTAFTISLPVLVFDEAPD